MMAEKRLYRSRDKMLGGVLAGFAEYVNADV
jgi:phage shock protein PspC (stress-responsive transcriptional regulator)